MKLRIKLPSSVRLEQGKQQISLGTTGTSKEGILFDFRALELLPISKKKQII